MPKQKGLIKLQGTLNGICYYPLNKEYLSRVAVGPSKKTIQNNPVYTKIKTNNQEFAGASKLSKAIRTGFLETAKQFQDTYMASRLTGVCRNIIKKGSGPLGKREAYICNNPKVLIGFQLNKHTIFNQVYTAKPIVTSNNNRRLITISIPKSNAMHLNKRPKNATHFQLIGALSLVSKYKCYSNKKAYYPVALKQNALGISLNTVPLVCELEHNNLQIKLQTPVTTRLSSNIDVTVWLGIQYLKLDGSQFQTLLTYQSMQCILVI